jgi:hypothetical protein
MWMSFSNQTRYYAGIEFKERDHTFSVVQCTLITKHYLMRFDENSNRLTLSNHRGIKNH